MDLPGTDICDFMKVSVKRNVNQGKFQFVLEMPSHYPREYNLFMLSMEAEAPTTCMVKKQVVLSRIMFACSVRPAPNSQN